MPRLNVIDPAASTGRVKEIFDGPLKGKHFNIFKGLANSGAGFDFYLGASGALGNAALTAAEREVIALVVAEANNCEYCAAAHTALGKMSGLTEGQTVEARKGHLGDARLDALARFTMRLHEKKGMVSDEDIATFRKAGYTDGHIVEVIACYALNIFTNYFNHTNQTQVDFPTPPVV